MSLSQSRNRVSRQPRVEINVVPLIDVFLVLVIIVLLTASFQQTAGVHVRLPASSMTRQPPSKQRELIVGVDAQGRFLWKGTAVTDAQLLTALRHHALEYGTTDRVTILGDENARHGRVVKAMALADRVHFTQLWVATKKQAVAKVPKIDRVTSNQ